MTEFRFYVQSEQVRGERRSYWIEKQRIDGSSATYQGFVEDFGTNKRGAEKRCAELNAASPPERGAK